MPHPRFLLAVLTAGVLAWPAAAARGTPAPRPLTLVFVGGSNGDGATPTLMGLAARLAALDAAGTVVVFTGNYAAGELPVDGAPGREAAERAVLAHVDATAAFVQRGGRVFFVAGHRDFGDGGTRAVRRLRKLLNHAYRDGRGGDDHVDVMPNAACGTPTLVELTSNVGLMLVSSQWWLQDPLTDPELNEGCETRTSAAFELELIDAYRGYRARRLIIASHHPLASYGELGGAFTAAAHLNPAPVLGSAWVFARQMGLVAQHHNHPRLRAYVDLVRTEAERSGAYVFASGHDESQQYLRLGHQAQLIAGTSARTAGPVVDPEPGDFAAASPGWVELALDAAGEGAARGFGPHGELLFEAPLPRVPALVTAPPVVPGDPTAVSFSKQPVWQLSTAAKLLAGSFYSEAFALRLPYEVLQLQTEAGGLQPYKVAGSGQTNSVRAHDPHGGDWAIRSTTKDSRRLLPRPFHRIDLLGRLLQHGYTANHPEAALAVPRLAEAVGVLHTRPRLMFMPDQPGLGAYRDFIANEVVMLEQRPNEPDEGTLPEHLGGDARFRDFDELLDRLHDKPWKHRLDQEAMLRARLLDVLIGDWDRHRGQWRFAQTDAPGGGKAYAPVPIDRDQAFANFDGALLALARVLTSQARLVQPYDADVRSLVWLVYNGRDVDAALLNQLTRAQWLDTAAQVQAALTDAVIDEAFTGWHPETYALDGQRIAAALKARRDQLPALAVRYFELLALRVDVVGSRSDDRFDVWFEPEGQVRVTVRQRRGDGAPWFDRSFTPAETAELRLYALEGDDVLAVHGPGHDSIALRFVGGPGKDRVTADAPVDARALRLYDSERGARIDPSVTVRDERSSLAELNQYEPFENHDPAYGTFTPGLLVNADNGAYLGGTYSHVVPGWKRRPFASRHDLGAYFATATLGLGVTYRGLFPQSLEGLDQQLDVALSTPSHARNFFGYTNTLVPDGPSADWYRVRQGVYEARYGLTYGFGGERSRAGLQVLGQVFVTEATPGRFVSVSPDVGADALGPRAFAGLRFFAETNTFDSLTLPRRGIALHCSLEGRADPVKGGDFSITYRVAGAAAVPLDRHERFVLLTRVTAEGIAGAHPFWFAPTLGEPQLRAYRQQQLAGEAAFAHSTDLRIDVVRFESWLPGTLGIDFAVDHGRVFGAGVADGYHVSLGGGVWWSIVDVVGLGVSYHRGLDGGSRVSFSAGSLFSSTGF